MAASNKNQLRFAGANSSIQSRNSFMKLIATFTAALDRVRGVRLE
jgi:hypothetical protein